MPVALLLSSFAVPMSVAYGQIGMHQSAAVSTAQAPYPYSNPQPALGQLGYGHYAQSVYGKPAYGYSDSSLGAVIGQLLGSRYSVTDRTAVRQCAIAAMQQAAVQYQPQPSGNAHPYGEGYNPAALMRITAVSEVRRREDGLHVSGLIDNRFGHPPYNHAEGYQNNGYAAAGDLSFRCTIDYRGIVFDLRVHRANNYRG